MKEIKDTEGNVIAVACETKDMDMDLLEQRIRESSKEFSSIPCPACHSWLLQPVDDEVSFCMDCGTYFDQNGTVISADELVRQGKLFRDEDGNYFSVDE